MDVLDIPFQHSQTLLELDGIRLDSIRKRSLETIVNTIFNILSLGYGFNIGMLADMDDATKRSMTTATVAVRDFNRRALIDKVDYEHGTGGARYAPTSKLYQLGANHNAMHGWLIGTLLQGGSNPAAQDVDQAAIDIFVRATGVRNTNTLDDISDEAGLQPEVIAHRGLEAFAAANGLTTVVDKARQSLLQQVLMQSQNQ